MVLAQPNRVSTMPFLARTHPRLSAAATLGLAVGILAPADSILSKILIGWNTEVVLGQSLVGFLTAILGFSINIAAGLFN